MFMDMFQRMNYISDNGELPIQRVRFCFFDMLAQNLPWYILLSRVPGNHHHDWQRIPAHSEYWDGVGAENCLKGGADQLILPPLSAGSEEVNFINPQPSCPATYTHHQVSSTIPVWSLPPNLSSICQPR